MVRSTRVPIAEPEAVAAQDQIAFPVAGDRAVVGLLRTVTDVDHVSEVCLGHFLCGPVVFTLSASGAQRGLDQPGQLPTRLNVEGLIDRLV